MLMFLRAMVLFTVVFSVSALVCPAAAAADTGDTEATNRMNKALSKIEIAVAGDLLGHLIGTISQQEGRAPVVGAEVTVTGRTSGGTWKRASTTVDNGLFKIDLPLGSTGPIDISTTSNERSAKLTVDSADIAACLTPRATERSNRISLEGEWDFVTDPPADLYSKPGGVNWSKIAVPSHWEMNGFKAETGTAAYQRVLKIPGAWQGKRIKFRSDGIYSRAEVWINGKRVGAHDGGSTPFELDITDAAKPGAENSIYMLVHDSSDAGNLDGMSYYAHLNMGGIWRPLELFCVESAHISRLAITTDFDDSYQNAELIADVEIANEQAMVIRDANLVLKCIDPNGKTVILEGLSAKVSLEPWERQKVTLRAKVTHPEQWSAEIPKLYKLKAEFSAPSRKPAVVEQRFGFREIEIKGRTFTINGKPIKMWGANRLDSHPLMGRAITPDVARQDVELMKGANLNAMRTTCYPQHPAAFDAADELGLYVEAEGPFCFVSVGYGPEIGRGKNFSEDLRLAPLTVSETAAMLERDRNHPSVVIWSVCNESVFGRIFQMAHKFARESDPTRPTSAGQSANLEIATYHNPTSMQRMKDTADFQMPVLFDEALGVFQGQGPQAGGLELDPGLRDYWVTAHFEPLEAIVKSNHHLGTQIWAWVDDAFLVPGRGIEYGRMNLPKTHFVDDVYGMPGRGIVGDPMWGLIDGWRRVRPEWWLCKKLFSPIRIKEEPLQPADTIIVPVENRNFFADLSRYLCKWRIGGETGELRANVPPQSSGTIVIKPRKAPIADDTLTLEFFNERGDLIDGYKLAFHAHDVPKPAFFGKPARIVEEPGSLDFGSFVRLVGAKCEITFDRTSGGLVRGLAANKQVLLAGPKLHVMKSYAPLEAYPEGWRFTGATYSTEGGTAVLNWNGSCGSDFTGGFAIRMDDAGDVEIDYSFTYTGAEMLAREIGIGLEVPLSCDRLEWDRRAEWSYYPEDHIGRPHGIAAAHPNVRQAVPAGDRPFGLDDHAWGCNDFRSAKRNIYWASLTGADGSGIRVISDGTQHVRATVSTRSIAVNILDYYGGSATGFSEWDGAYGNGHTIKTGDILKGVVRLQLLK